MNGFSDLSLHVGYVLWRDRDVLPSTWVEARGFGKAPTGKSNQTVNGVQDPHLQLGTGSWDFGFGLAGAHRLEWGSLYASALYRENLMGSLDYRYGDVVLANLTLETPLSHFVDEPDPRSADARRRAELPLRREGSARTATRIRTAEARSCSRRRRCASGCRGSKASGRRSCRLAVQIPFTQSWLNGQQHEGPVWSAGLGMAY